MNISHGGVSNDLEYRFAATINRSVLSGGSVWSRRIDSLRRVGAVTVCMLMAGCTIPPSVPKDSVLRERATLCLNRALRYPENPAVRAQAIEAAQEVFDRNDRLAIREGLKDAHAGVRFAACVALGEIGDPSAVAAVQPLVKDPDPNVKVGACFAMERMGDPQYRRVWVNLLRRHEQPAVRRNAVMLLGRLGDKRVIPLLESVSFEDKDEGVQLQAIEAQALLGDADAINRLILDAYGAVGFRQPFSLLVLGKVKSDRVLPALRSRLANAPYPEARLAAARSLGMQGDPCGYDYGVSLLSWNKPEQNLPDDPPQNQIMRVQTMAAMALGDIGDRRALGWLRQRMESSDDPRVQLAAARSILMILHGSTPTGAAGNTVTRVGS